MERGMLVSVIVPVFNVEPYLAEALDSVIRQTYTNLEIIVIDDGSTDGSGRICDEYAGKDRRIRVIHQENRGLSAARNAGLDVMKGEAVSFLDSDDAYYPEFIETMMTAMIRENAEIVTCKNSIRRTTGKMTGSRDEKIYPLIQPGVYGRAETLRALADDQINHSVWNKLYRKELWSGIRFPEGSVYEDIAITYQLIDRSRKICVLDLPLYMYRKRPGSICGTKTSKNITDYFNSRSRFEQFIEDNIPEIFTEKQLKRFRRTGLRRRILRYIHYSRNPETDGDSFLKELRKQIAEEGKKADILKCSGRIQCCYWIIRFCPGLLKPACLLYRYFRG